MARGGLHPPFFILKDSMKTNLILALLLLPISCHKTKDSGKPVALVKVEDTIYQCQDVWTNHCGTNADCGEDKFRCVNGIEIEWLTQNVNQVK